MKLPRLREVRELHGWSQKKLAEESGTSRDSISNYETGQREAWPSTAKKLADALSVTIADLMEEGNTPKPVPATPLLEWALTAPDEEFNHRIKTADKHEIEELLQLTNLVPQKRGPHRDRILERISEIAARFLELGGDSSQDRRSGQEVS